jgi:hypothetical protein
LQEPHVEIGSDSSIEKVVLILAQEAEFDVDIARHEKLGIGAPGERSYPYEPDLNGTRSHANHRGGVDRRGHPLSVVEKCPNFPRVLGDTW